MVSILIIIGNVARMPVVKMLIDNHSMDNAMAEQSYLSMLKTWTIIFILLSFVMAV